MDQSPYVRQMVIVMFCGEAKMVDQPHRLVHPSLLQQKRKRRRMGQQAEHLQR
jgi:hypothetical protein